MRRRKIEAMSSLSTKARAFWKKDSRFSSYDPDDCDRALSLHFMRDVYDEDEVDILSYLDSVYSGEEELSKEAVSYVLAYLEMSDLIKSMASKIKALRDKYNDYESQSGADTALELNVPKKWY